MKNRNFEAENMLKGNLKYSFRTNFFHFKILQVIFITLVSSSFVLSQTTFTWNNGGGDGNWTNSANWSKSGASSSNYPGQNSSQNDQVSIPNGSGYTVTLNASITTNSVTLVTITGDATLAMGANNLTTTGSTAHITGTGALTISTGTLDAGGNIDVSTLTCSGSSVIKLDGNWGVSTFAHSTSTVTFDGTTAQSIDSGSDSNFNSLTVSKASGTLTVNSTNIKTDASDNGSGTLTISAGTLDLNGKNLSSFDINVNGGTFTSGSGTHTFFGTLTLSSGIFNANSSTISFDPQVSNTVISRSGGTFNAATSLIQIQGPAPNTGDIIVESHDDITFYQFKHAPGSGFGGKRGLTFQRQSGVLSPKFTFSNQLIRGAKSTGITVTNGTIEYSSSTLRYEANTDVMTVGAEWPSSNGPTNIINASAVGIDLGGSRTISGSLSLQQTSGDFDVSSGTLSITGSLIRKTTGTTGITTSGGSISYGSGATLEYSPTTPAAVTVGSEWPSSNSPSNVTVNNSGNTVTLAGARDIAKTLTMTAGTLAIGTNNLTILGSLSASDIAGNATITASSGTIQVGNAGSTNNQTMTGSLIMDNLTLNKTGANDTLTISGNPTISNGITLTNGDMLIQGSVTVSAGGYTQNNSSTTTISGSGNLTITAGSYTQNGGTTTISAGKLLVSSGDITLAAGTITNNAAVEISNAANKLDVQTGTTFTTGTGATSIKLDEINLSGTGHYNSGKVITPVGASVTFTLASASTFDFTATQTIPASGTITFGNVIVSGGATITAANTMIFYDGSDLTLTGNSTFDFDDQSLTLNGTSNLSIASGSTVKTGTTDISTFTASSLAGTIDYDGVTSQDLFGAAYTNLVTNTTSGSLVSSASTKVTGTLTFTSGTIDATTNSLTLSTSATANATNSSFVLGSVIRETDGSTKIFSFPVGNGSNERGVTITFTTEPATSNTITVIANGTMSSPTSDETGIKSVETDGYWTISTSLGALPSAYTLSLNTDGFSPAISAASAINIVRGTAETFNDESGTSENADTDNISADFTSAGFGDFAIGNKVSTFTWDAGGGDNNWTTNANWVGDAQPQTGDIVLFNHSAAAGTYTVTFNAGTDASNFASITLSGGGTAITLDLNAGTIDLSGTALTINNSDKLIFSGSNVNNYSSGNTDYKTSSTVEYQSGTLYPDTYGDLITNNAALLSASSGITCESFTLSGAGNVSISGALTVNGLLTKGGNGTLSPTSISTGTIDINTGDINVTNALTVSGATFTCDGSGTLTAGSISATSTNLDVNAGAVTVNGDLDLGANDLQKDGTGTVTVSGGTLTAANITFDANSDAGNDGTIDVSGAGRYTISNAVTVTSGETLNIKGTATGPGNSLGAVTNSGTIAISVDAGSVSATTISNSGSITISGTKSLTLSGTYSGAGTMTSTGSGSVSLQAFNPSGNVDFSSSTSAITIAGAVTLAGGTFTPTANTSFTSTTFTVNGGSISSGSGTIKFNGSGAQNLANGSGSATFYNLTIDNSNGVTLNDPASVAGALTLTNGKVSTTTTNLLTVNGGTISGSSSSFIDGPLAYAGTGTFTFHIGKGSEYRPIQLINIAGSSPNIRFEMFASDPGGTVSGGLTNISTVRYWQGSLLSGSFTGGSVKLQWGSNDGVNGTLSNLRVVTSSSAAGTYSDAGNSATTGDGTSGTVTSNSLSTIQFFTLGDAASDNSLPVELVSFNANNDVNGVKLSWSVASEIDNQAFILQRRERNRNAEFELVDEVGGRGTVASEMEYEYLDKNVKNNLSYEYRLLSRDYSGLVHTYGTGLVEITVEMIPGGFVLSQNYPNPFNPSTTIKFSLSEPAQVKLSIYDISGKEVVRLVNGENLVPNKYDFRWNAKDRNGRSVATGVYFYRMVINSGEHILTRKMILVK